MKPWLRLTLPLVGLALVCRLLSLSPPAGLNQPLQVAGLGPRLPAWDHGSIKGEKPRPARPLQRWSKAWNSIPLVRDRSHLLSPRLCVDCGQSWSTRPGEPWATGTDGTLASCRSSRQLKPTTRATFFHEITAFNCRIEESRFCNRLELGYASRQADLCLGGSL
jgi:hypothetical protein